MNIKDSKRKKTNQKFILFQEYLIKLLIRKELGIDLQIFLAALCNKKNKTKINIHSSALFIILLIMKNRKISWFIIISNIRINFVLLSPSIPPPRPFPWGKKVKEEEKTMYKWVRLILCSIITYIQTNFLLNTKLFFNKVFDFMAKLFSWHNAACWRHKLLH